jgi:hypothetical protein
MGHKRKIKINRLDSMTFIKNSVRQVVWIFVAVNFSACQDDEGGGCTTCRQPQTLDFEVCENADGEAVVNGEDTDTAYEVYIANLVAEGADCGI